MEFSEVQKRAIEVKEKYKDYETQFLGRPWNYVEQTQGLVVDVGELTELMMAKAKTREYKGENLDTDIAHELSDILWATLVIANEIDIDIEKEFLKTMDSLDERIENKNEEE